MYPRQQLPDALVKRAEDQAGVLTTSQLIDGGLSRRVISRMSRDWVPVAQGLHLLGPPSFDAAVWAGVLRGGPRAVVGGRAAGYLSKIIRDEPEEVLVWAPIPRNPLAVGQWVVQFRRGERKGVFSLPRTTVEASLLDISDVSTENEVVAAVARALSQRKTTPDRVLRELDTRRGVQHRALLQQLLAKSARGIESALEWRFQTKVLAPHGLPLPDRQVRRVAGRVDGIYERYGLIVELDGLRDHTEAWRDMKRDNLNLVFDDNRTLRFGWFGVENEACLAARMTASLLWKGGWAEPMLQAACCFGEFSLH
ncbi:MAG: type IV toxin-antitoxin system AbiEi family antitoxin domain-containing protein [Propionibacteriaceae bacterium]|nr:type IV toxin-antitoxin system AbiEi family antitoxin domain-containing protein [Propionibacteriaceae bacterium]